MFTAMKRAYDSVMHCSRLIKAIFLVSAFGFAVFYHEFLKQGSSNLVLKKCVKEKPRLLEPLASKTLGPAGNATAKDEVERIWNYMYNRQYDCTKSEYRGGRRIGDGDGMYDVCTEEQFWPAAYDSNYKCLVYLFGVGHDFSFDDEMARKGCEVHSFDPSEKYVKDGLIRDSGVVFHQIGISDKDIDSTPHRGWKVRTLKSLIKELGHTDRHLDFLKVDTDGTGVEIVMQQLLDTGLYKCVRQYAMELHLNNPLSSERNLKRCRYLYKLMVDLGTMSGLRLYNTTDNVRFIKDPTYTQRTSKTKMLNGESVWLLFESAFVNFDVGGRCGEYL